MGKKQTTELRTIPVNLSLHKYSLNDLRKEAEQDWGIRNIQPFFPSLEKLFKTEDLTSPLEYGIQFSDEIQSILSKHTIRTKTGTKSIHSKVSMILSPFKLIQEEYGRIGLPSTKDQSQNIYQKFQNPNNAVYVGSLFSAILGESGCPNFPRVYGIFSGTAEKHTIDISDDYEELSERGWFSQNIGKTFDLRVSDKVSNSNEFRHTRTGKLELDVADDITLEGVEELDVQHVEAEAGQLQKMFQEQKSEEEMTESSSVSTGYLFEVHSCDCDDDMDEEELVEDEQSEPFAWATFYNVPVQITIMEQCEGTFYQLCMTHFETEKHQAWMAQIIFALAFAQRNFGFVHNDLHANNVMYVSTDKEFMYYNLNGKFYKVPTYGYLIKIIDFERGTGSIKISGMKDPKFFMSDHFMPSEEAGGQYNVDPYHVGKFPVVKPNASFDLARFATSMFWDLFQEGPEHEEYKTNTLFQWFMRWMTTEDGKSVLFRDDKSRHDRYHAFHLYKAIARFCKSAVPTKELESSCYVVKSVPIGESVCVI